VTRKKFTRLFISVFAPDCILSHPLWWWVDPACRDRNDHKLPGSSYGSDTVLFSHKWLTFYSGCLLISKWL